MHQKYVCKQVSYLFKTSSLLLAIAAQTNDGENSFRKMRSKMATTTIKYVQGSEKIRPEDTVTRVMGCATMWHESSEEIVEMLKSIFRIDEDYSAR